MIKTFIFRQSNKDKWLTIRENFGYELSSLIRLSNLTNYDKDFQVVIEELKHKPSNQQRAYYFSVILPAINNHLKAEQGTYYPDVKVLDEDIREAIKQEFGLYKTEISKITGKEVKKPLSLSNQKGTKEDTKKYIEAVLFWAARDYGLDIPSPYVKI